MHSITFLVMLLGILFKFRTSYAYTPRVSYCKLDQNPTTTKKTESTTCFYRSVPVITSKNRQNCAACKAHVGKMKKREKSVLKAIQKGAQLSTERPKRLTTTAVTERALPSSTKVAAKPYYDMQSETTLMAKTSNAPIVPKIETKYTKLEDFNVTSPKYKAVPSNTTTEAIEVLTTPVLSTPSITPKNTTKEKVDIANQIVRFVENVIDHSVKPALLAKYALMNRVNRVFPIARIESRPLVEDLLDAAYYPPHPEWIYRNSQESGLDH
ncbi:hypothetical protein ACOME3_004017 [Neoechinorhynchus agilis]